MSLRIGDLAPDFTADSTTGPIRFHDWIGDQWCVLFSHPKDFTPVCTTELGALARRAPEFERRGVRVLGLSVDSLESHEAWLDDIEDTQGASVDFPLIADVDGKVASLYGMLDPGSDDPMTVRSVFVIGPDKKIKLMLTYPASTGRNFDELLRSIDSLQLTAKAFVATPSDWRSGEEVFVLPSLDEQRARELFPGGWNEVRPYMKVVPQPNPDAR